MGMSLLHSPQLLILDEPTVGVDPLLRRSIWNYLLTLSDTRTPRPIDPIYPNQSHLPRNRATTIIITTHYIEEARQCSVVGMMSGGRLLAEESPSSLMQSHGSVSLEQVFLKLCTFEQNPTEDLDSRNGVGGIGGTLLRLKRQ